MSKEQEDSNHKTTMHELKTVSNYLIPFKGNNQQQTPSSPQHPIMTVNDHRAMTGLPTPVMTAPFIPSPNPGFSLWPHNSFTQWNNEPHVNRPHSDHNEMTVNEAGDHFYSRGPHGSITTCTTPSQDSPSKGSPLEVNPTVLEEEGFAGFGDTQQTIFNYEPATIASYLQFHKDKNQGHMRHNLSQQWSRNGWNRGNNRDCNGNWRQNHQQETRRSADLPQANYPVMDADNLNLEHRDEMPIQELVEKFKEFKVKPKLLCHEDKNKTMYDSKGRLRLRKPSVMQCAFCISNGEEEHVYRSHILKDADGRVVCPVLYMYNCPICRNGGGPRAHTVRYCPLNKFGYGWKRLPRSRSNNKQDGYDRQRRHH